MNEPSPPPKACASEHDAVFEMLPWHVNGTLSVFEHNRVSRHLVGCARCRTELAFLREIEGAVLGSDSLDDAMERSLRHLQARLAHEARGGIAGARRPDRPRIERATLGTHLRALVPARLRATPLHLGAPVTVFAILLLMLIVPAGERGGPPQRAAFETLTAPAPATLAELRVRFVDDLSREAIDALLEAEGLVRVAGPSPQGLVDLRRLRAALAGEAPITLLDAPWSLLFLLIIWLLHPVLAGLAFAGIALLLALAGLEAALTGAARSDQRLVALEADSALRVLHASHRLHHGVRQRWHDRLAAGLRFGDVVERRREGVQALARGTRMIVQIAVLGGGAALVLEGDLTAGGMIAASLLVGRALAPAERASALWQTVQAWQEAGRRLSALAPGRASARRCREPVHDEAQGLRVREASLRPNLLTRPALTRVSFDLPRGSTCALVGPGGAGKSALAALLGGTRDPDLGEVRFAGIAAADLASSNDGLIAHVEPDAGFAQASLLDNLVHFGAVDAGRVAQLLRLTGLQGVIETLPDGVGTMLDARGAPLPHGQRAALALARGLYQDPKLLVLDNPQHMTDAACRQAVLALIETAAADRRTLVIVTGDPAVIDRVDRVLYLRDGTIAAFGSREEVAAALQSGVPRVAARSGRAPGAGTTPAGRAEPVHG